jgi:hypothetical protein
MGYWYRTLIKEVLIMWYVIFFLLGGFITFIVTSILIVGSNAEKIENAYKKGVEDGKKLS